MQDTQSPARLFRSGPSSESARVLELAASRGPKERESLKQALLAAAKPLNLQVSFVGDADAAGEAVARVVLGSEPEWGDAKRIVAWDHPLLRQIGLQERLQEHQIPVTHAEAGQADQSLRRRWREATAASFVGLTSADFCLADTATLVMRARPGQPRSVSLVPSIHVAVIAEDQILADLRELYALLRWDPGEQRDGLTNCMTLVSGPSKTADIEATLVHGAHGPRELHLIVCP